MQIFDVALAAWLGQRPGLCIFEQTCGTAMAMEHNGDLYSCDHFVEPALPAGQHHANAAGGTGRFARSRRSSARTSATPCRATAVECAVRFICNGGCPKDRVLRTPDGEPGLNYLCAGYKAFFTHIDRPMRIMADLLRQGRAPAEIMSMPPTPAAPARPRHRKR